MKYGYTVKKNGVLYTPGMDVPGDAPAKADSQELAGEAFSEEEAEQDKPKRGRKSKEE